MASARVEFTQQQVDDIFLRAFMDLARFFSHSPPDPVTAEQQDVLNSNYRRTAEEYLFAIQTPLGYNKTFMGKEMISHLTYFLNWTMFGETKSIYLRFLRDVHHFPPYVLSEPRYFQVRFAGYLMFYAHFLPLCCLRWNFPPGVFPGDRLPLVEYLDMRSVIRQIVQLFDQRTGYFLHDCNLWTQFYDEIIHSGQRDM